MDYETFKAGVLALVDVPYVEKLWHYPDGNKYGTRSVPKFDYVASKEEIGGSRGGSCWGGISDGYTRSDAPDGYGFLDVIIENMFPNTSFIAYRKIVAALETHEETHYEYYGNYTTYRVRWIRMEQLHKLLCA